MGPALTLMYLGDKIGPIRSQIMYNLYTPLCPSRAAFPSSAAGNTKEQSRQPVLHQTHPYNVMTTSIVGTTFDGSINSFQTVVKRHANLFEVCRRY